MMIACACSRFERFTKYKYLTLSNKVFPLIMSVEPSCQAQQWAMETGGVQGQSIDFYWRLSYCSTVLHKTSMNPLSGYNCTLYKYDIIMCGNNLIEKLIYFRKLFLQHTFLFYSHLSGFDVSMQLFNSVNQLNQLKIDLEFFRPRSLQNFYCGSTIR